MLPLLVGLLCPSPHDLAVIGCFLIIAFWCLKCCLPSQWFETSGPEVRFPEDAPKIKTDPAKALAQQVKFMLRLKKMRRFKERKEIEKKKKLELLKGWQWRLQHKSGAEFSSYIQGCQKTH
jgi:hypothetical protein